MSSATPSVAWRFLVDENMPRPLASHLTVAGYLVEDVRDVKLSGHPDHEVWAYAQAHGQLVITKDKDFSDIRTYPIPHFGIVIVDVPDNITVTTFIQTVVDSLNSLAGQSLTHAVVTIAPGRVRVRR
jgi:predicted nuclease of predicted toxin-antitoxin system